MGKIYKIERLKIQPPNGDNVIAMVISSGGTSYPLRHYVYHSPSGFGFAYAGSGPADLALAILLDHFNEWPTRDEIHRGSSLAWRGHQKFKVDFVAPTEYSGFIITTKEIDAWVNDVWLPDGGLAELRKLIKRHD